MAKRRISDLEVTDFPGVLPVDFAAWREERELVGKKIAGVLVLVGVGGLVLFAVLYGFLPPLTAAIVTIVVTGVGEAVGIFRATARLRRRAARAGITRDAVRRAVSRSAPPATAGRGSFSPFEESVYSQARFAHLDQAAGAGWYPDPADAGRQRWWDGRDWTDATRPAGGENSKEGGN